MEEDLLDYTHAYFPADKFDTVFVHENYALGKKGNTYCAFITKNSLTFRKNTTNDLIQPGKKTFWITEAGSQKDDLSFDKFCQRILNNTVTFDSDNFKLTYQSKDKIYELQFGGDFYVNEKIVGLNYQRFDSPYCKAKRKPESISIEFNDKYLYLDFYNMKREF